MKAYTVTEATEQQAVIIFASRSVVARRQGANELNVAFEEIESCIRAPWADQYHTQQNIPADVAIDNGWWLECTQCGCRIDSDLFNYETEQSLHPIGSLYFAFCTPSCRYDFDVHKARDRLNEAYGIALMEHMLSAEKVSMVGRPYVYSNIEGVIKQASVKFTFPNAKYGGQLAWDDFTDHSHRTGVCRWKWTVAAADLERWKEFEASLEHSPKQQESE